MKLPKFMKKSNAYTPQRVKLNAATITAMSQNHQLLLTDEICRFQPQKNRRSTAINTPNNKENFDFCDSPSTRRPKVVSIKSTPFVEADSFMFFKETPRTASTVTKVFQIDTTATPVSKSGGAGRFLKSSQPKRLQGNTRLQNNAKLTSYDLRSSTTSNSYIKNSTANQQQQQLNSANLMTTRSKSNLLDINQTPVRCLTSTSNSLLHELITNEQTPAKQQQQQQETTSGFSLAKLTKFVSRSALKVIHNSRKSLDAKRPSSTCSSANTSINTSSSNTSLEEATAVSASASASTNIYNYIDENFIINRPPSNGKDATDSCCKVVLASIYKSKEQEELFKQKLSQQISAAKLNSQYYSKAGASRPVMGITSLMIRQYKRQHTSSNSNSNNSSSSFNCLATGVYSSTMTGAYLVGMPCVFNNKSSNDNTESNSISFKSVNYSTSTANNYDHLARTNSNQQTSKYLSATSDLGSSIESNKSSLATKTYSHSVAFQRAISVFNGSDITTNRTEDSSPDYETVEETVF